jgi:hypothetical protein
MSTGSSDESRIAEEIMSALPSGSAVRVCCEDRRLIRYSVQAAGIRLRSVVLDRAALRRLGLDPARTVKVEYLQRDLRQAAKRRSEFRYPRAIRRASVRPAEIGRVASVR